LLFLVATGLTLIFGVLNVVNFAHGTLYMVGAYLAYTAYKISGSFAVAVLVGCIGTAIYAVLFERLAISRVYGRGLLMQLLVCYAVVRIMDNLVRLVWGANFLSMGMPDTFQVAPVRIAGGFVPPFYLFLIGVALGTGLLLWLLIRRTHFGKKVRAAAYNGEMISALGVNTTLLYILVFALGGLLAGLAGALAAPIRSLLPGMGFSILIDSFVVTVIGGMGSIPGALIGALLVGLTRSFGSLFLPMFTDGLTFVLMIIVLIWRPSGLLGKEAKT
jgi:branched-chain amino acid transport system permease protein